MSVVRPAANPLPFEHPAARQSTPTRFRLPPSVDIDLRAGESGVLGDRVLEGDKGGCVYGVGRQA